MSKIPAFKNKNRWTVFKTGAVAITLFVIATALYEFSPFLLDIFQSAVSKLSGQTTGVRPAVSSLRGFIYDQNFNELAVSYRLYSLNARPAEVTDYKDTAQALAQATGKQPASIERRLKSSRELIRLADMLEEPQAAEIAALNLPGVFCTPAEYRFYPAHTAASHVLGFMDGNTGLAGLEGRYDAVLSSHTQRSNPIPPGIDLKGQQNVGAGRVDLILTLDLHLQRRLEQVIKTYLNSQKLEKGMGLLLEPGTGRILALVNQPSFNPNYFWKAQEGSRENRIYSQLLDCDLIRPVLVRAAAIERGGVEGDPLLPVTVAAPDYGFSPDTLDSFSRRIRLYDPVSSAWEGGASQESQEGRPTAITGVQIGATLASLVNGGWRITPFVIDSIYDHATKNRLYRKDTSTWTHILDPALGVKIRRNLFADWLSAPDNKILYQAEKMQRNFTGDPGRLAMQRLFVGMVPAQYPKYLLVLAVESSAMRPQEQKAVKDDTLVQLGSRILSYAEAHPPQPAQATAPPALNEDNKHQFFISQRLAGPKTFEEGETRTATMPALQGLSLRKALQKMTPYKLKVNIRGSGTVVAQSPRAGASLLGANECTLTLNEP